MSAADARTAFLASLNAALARLLASGRVDLCIVQDSHGRITAATLVPREPEPPRLTITRYGPSSTD